MIRLRNLVVAGAVATSAVLGVGWHFSASGSALAQACNFGYPDKRSEFQNLAFWFDRAGLKLRYAADKAALARALIDHARQASDCARWQDSIPYLEEAVVAAEGAGATQERLLVEAIEWLALRHTFTNVAVSPRTAELWRRAIRIRARSFAQERDDLINDKYLLALVLGRECFSGSNKNLLWEAQELLDEVIVGDPMNTDAWEIRGDIPALQGQWSDAERFYRQSFVKREHEVGPMEGLPWRTYTAEKLAIVLALQGKRSEADAMKVVAKNARYGHPLKELGKCRLAPLSPESISPTSKLWPF